MYKQSNLSFSENVGNVLASHCSHKYVQEIIFILFLDNGISNGALNFLWALKAYVNVTKIYYLYYAEEGKARTIFALRQQPDKQ